MALTNTKGVVRMIDWDSPQWGQDGHNVHVSAYGDLAGQEHGQSPAVTSDAGGAIESRALWVTLGAGID